MQRVFFTQKTDYKKSTPHISDPDFQPLAVINDQKAQKNGTKKTVFWVKKKKKEEDGTIRGEKWRTSQQYIGDWKDNKKEGYGIKIYDNKDKYEGFWQNDMRHGKGTYWLCIGKNKYRKLYTGDWVENQKDGYGTYFYKDGSCYDGSWKSSKRDGKGLMMYANEDIYEGSWQGDLRHGYGILEKKSGDKYYGYWNLDLKEGQGYYYFSKTGKIYLGEWHEDNPRCGIFTDVDDELLKKEYKKHFMAEDPPSVIPKLNLKNPDAILEESINNVHFIRNIKLVKNKTFQDLFPSDAQSEIIKMFSQRQYATLSEDDKEKEIKAPPEKVLTIAEFKKIIQDKLSYEISNETIELIFYALGITLNYTDTKIDFLLFARLFYLLYNKLNEEEAADEDKPKDDTSNVQQGIENYTVNEGNAEECKDLIQELKLEMNANKQEVQEYADENVKVYDKNENEQLRLGGNLLLEGLEDSEGEYEDDDMNFRLQKKEDAEPVM